MSEYSETIENIDATANVEALTAPESFTVALVRPACKAPKMTPYESALTAIGAIVKPLDSDGNVQKILMELENVDGILLPGGNDISPVFYGGRNSYGKFEYLGCDEASDRTDLAAARWAYDNDVACFGICRGHQVMNVAREGMLFEDLITSGATNFNHRLIDSQNPPTHGLTFIQGTKIGLAFGDRIEDANSNHHQAVSIPGRDMIVSARSDDGIVEGTEAPDRKFYVSTQFHPERLDGGVKLFNRFARVCKARSAARKAKIAEDQARAAEEAMAQAKWAAEVAAAAAKAEEEHDRKKREKLQQENNETSQK